MRGASPTHSPTHKPTHTPLLPPIQTWRRVARTARTRQRCRRRASGRCCTRATRAHMRTACERATDPPRCAALKRGLLRQRTQTCPARLPRPPVPTATPLPHPAPPCPAPPCRRTVRKLSCCACTAANCFVLNLFTLFMFSFCCFCPRVLGATFKVRPRSGRRACRAPCGPWAGAAAPLCTPANLPRPARHPPSPQGTCSMSSVLAAILGFLCAVALCVCLPRLLCPAVPRRAWQCCTQRPCSAC